MSKPIKALGISAIEFSETEDAKIKAMVIKDTSEKITAHLVNPDTLGALLEQALGLAAHWSDDTDLAIDTITGPRSALPANNMEISKGRTSSEVSLSLSVGQIRMTYLLQVDVLLSSFAKILPLIDTGNALKPTPH